MTTIAYKDGVLAADTQASAGDNRLGTAVKIVRTTNGDLAGAAGRAPYANAFLRWVNGLESGQPPEAKKGDDFFDRGCIFRRNGKIEVYEPDGMFEIRAPYYALGSGRPEALGAMFVGANAEEAVKAAAAHDLWTGGEITVLRHDS